MIGRAAKALQFLLWLPLGYLAALTAAGMRSVPAAGLGPGRLRFAIVVPAHNEEAVIADTLASLASVDYPSELMRVVVVADASTDRTAELSRAAGVEVWERGETTGKGDALHWAFERLLHEPWDAVAVVDADTLVTKEFFRHVEQRLLAGCDAVQARYDVANPEDTVVTRLSAAAFATQSLLRPLGRAALGGAAKLQGNGMVFSRALVQRVGWVGRGLAEDVDQWLTLVGLGVRPAYEHRARVAGTMPSSIAAARVQRFRWEAGRAQLVRRHLGPGLRRAVERRDPVLFEALASELVFPPLATLASLVAAAGLARRATDGTGARTAAAQSGVLALHVLAALHLAGGSRRTYAALALAPAAVAWKLAVKLQTLARRDEEWVTTPRAGLTAPGRGTTDGRTSRVKGGTRWS